MATGPVGGGPTFTQLDRQFNLEQGGPDRHLRFQGARGLYVSSQTSLARIRDFFGFPDALKAREKKREDGFEQIRQSLVREHGPENAKLVLDRIESGGRDLSHGVKRSDLDLIRETVDELLGSPTQRALEDPNLKAIEPMSPHVRVSPEASTFRQYFRRHEQVLLDPAFWSHPKAKINAESFGCILAVNILERIARSNSVTEYDLADLQRALGPYDGFKPAVPPLSPHLLGPMTFDKLSEMADLVHSRYMAEESPLRINFDGGEKPVRQAFSDPNTTGLGKFTAMSDALDIVISNQGLSFGSISDPIKAMMKE